MKFNKQMALNILTKAGDVDQRSARWKKEKSYANLIRQGHFGGAVRNKAFKRPFDSKKALHVVFKSSYCKGVFRFSNSFAKIKLEKLIQKWARKKNIQIYKMALAGNHIHLLIRAKSKLSLSGFLKCVSGDLALKMKKWAQKLKLSIEGSFWDSRPYSRVVSFGREFKNALAYLEKNILEALGFIQFTVRKHRINKIVMQIEKQLLLRPRSSTA